MKRVNTILCKQNKLTLKLNIWDFIVSVWQWNNTMDWFVHCEINLFEKSRQNEKETEMLTCMWTIDTIDVVDHMFNITLIIPSVC